VRLPLIDMISAFRIGYPHHRWGKRTGNGLLVEKSEIAPWFGQPGRGTQYRLIDPNGGPKYFVQQAIDDGVLFEGF
jgi:hypothetical protein